MVEVFTLRTEMIAVKDYKRSELVNLVKSMLPVYVVSKDQAEIFKAEHISKIRFRNNPAIEMFSIKSKEMNPKFPQDTKFIEIRSNQYITKDFDTADMFAKTVKANKIKEEMSSLEKKYLDYKQFIKDNPEYFVL